MSTNVSPQIQRQRRTLRVALTAIVALALLAVSLVALQPPVAHSQLAAVVNNDEPVEVDGTLAPMGRQLTAELVELDGPFEWEITTSDRAAAGLISGHYAAAVIIPEEFSADVTSLSSLSHAVQANVVVEMPPGAGEGQATAAELEVWKATANLGSMMTEQFVAGIFGGLGEMGSQLQEAADGAEQLASGANTAATGAGALAEGNRELGSGAHQAADGAQQLVDGLGALSSGGRELATGAGALSGGANELSDGARSLTDGAKGLAEGSKELADGAGDLASGAQELAAGTGALSGGVSQYVDGVSQVADGMSQINDGVQQFAPYLEQAQEGIVVAGDVLTDLQRRLTEFCSANPSIPLCQGEGEYAPDRIFEALWGILGEVGTGIDGLQQLTGGIAELSGGLDVLSTEGVNLSAGAQALAGGMQQYADGVAEYSAGASEFTQGMSLYAAGTSQFADGASQLAGGVSQFQGGVSQYTDGVSQAAQGASALPGGLSAIGDGADAIADGTTELGDGLVQIGDGIGVLADGLGLAGDQVPSISDDQAESLGQALASPVDRPLLVTGKSAGPAAAFALLLWLATMLLQSAYPPVVSYLSSSTLSAGSLTLRALRHPALWSVTIGALGGLIVALLGSASPLAVLGLVAGGAFVGVAFAAIQQTLALILGRGWVTASVAALVLGVAASLAAPGSSLLDDIANTLPAGSAGRMLSAILVPGTGSAVGPILILAIWALLALVVSIAATASKRKNPEVAIALGAV